MLERENLLIRIQNSLRNGYELNSLMVAAYLRKLAAEAEVLLRNYAGKSRDCGMLANFEPLQFEVYVQ